MDALNYTAPLPAMAAAQSSTSSAISKYLCTGHPRHAHGLAKSLSKTSFNSLNIRYLATAHAAHAFVGNGAVIMLSTARRHLGASVGSLQSWRWAARPTLRTSAPVQVRRCASHQSPFAIFRLAWQHL